MYQLGSVKVYGAHEKDPGGWSVKLLPYAHPAAYGWWNVTTRQMLEVLSVKDVKGKKVLDFGCGASAILAIAAAKGGAKSVTACEIHPELADIARQQIEANGLDIPVVPAVDSEFDFVLANIGDAHLAGNLSRMGKHGIATGHGGELIRW